MTKPLTMGETMTPEQAGLLRKPFDRKQVDQIPKRNNKTGNTIYLDYVGHAHVTDRLLQVDPNWFWTPMAFDASGQPVIDEQGGIWIWLTVCNVTRPGYGWADGDKGGNATKEAIGDAIRNAAMRFGVALDLWMKEPASIPVSVPAPSKATAKTPAKKLSANVPASLTVEDPLAEIFGLVASAQTVDELRVIWQANVEHLESTLKGVSLRNFLTSRKDEVTVGE